MASFELECKLTRKLPAQSGNSSRGAWAKQEFVVEYQDGNYPSNLCLNVWGADKVKELENFSEGDRLKLSFRLSSREYNGRWYTEARAWRIERVGESAPDYVPSRAPYEAQVAGSPVAATPDSVGASTGFGVHGDAADGFSEKLDGPDDLPF